MTSYGVATYWYFAPECFENNQNSKITTKVDIWSLGIILYEILFNKKPFCIDINTPYSMFKNNVIHNEDSIDFPNDVNISDNCKEFIINCLKFNQNERYDVYQALNSKFIQYLNLNKDN